MQYTLLKSGIFMWLGIILKNNIIYPFQLLGQVICAKQKE